VTRAPTPRPRSRKNRTPKRRTMNKQAARWFAMRLREFRRERDSHARMNIEAALADILRDVYGRIGGDP
jgi:hypothetical protein